MDAADASPGPCKGLWEYPAPRGGRDAPSCTNPAAWGFLPFYPAQRHIDPHAISSKSSRSDNSSLGGTESLSQPLCSAMGRDQALSPCYSGFFSSLGGGSGPGAVLEPGFLPSVRPASLSAEVQQLHCFPALLLFTNPIVQPRPAKGKGGSAERWQRDHPPIGDAIGALARWGQVRGPTGHTQQGRPLQAEQVAINGFLWAMGKELVGVPLGMGVPPGVGVPPRGVTGTCGCWWHQPERAASPKRAGDAEDAVGCSGDTSVAWGPAAPPKPHPGGGRSLLSSTHRGWGSGGAPAPPRGCRGG